MSPYNYVANNPIKFVDPDEKQIIIPTNTSRINRWRAMRNLRKLTHDKLSYNKSTGVVSVVRKLPSEGRTNKPAGSNLIANLIADNNTVTINVKSSGGNKANATNWTSAQNGTGSDAVVTFDYNSSPSIPTEDSKTGNVSGDSRPNQIGMAHELIHADHITNGDVNLNNQNHTYLDDQGNSVTQSVRSEELRTVGLQAVKSTDITENQIRSEQRGTKKKKRGAY